MQIFPELNENVLRIYKNMIFIYGFGLRRFESLTFCVHPCLQV